MFDIFDTSGFPPRWQCGPGWTPSQGWLYIAGDLLTWSAYFAIPILILVYFYKKKRNAQFHWGYVLFAAFILACGTTHLLDAVIFWLPLYRLNAWTLFFTGIISWVTVVYLYNSIPVAMTMKTEEELQAEVDMRIKAEVQLQHKLSQLHEAQAIAKVGSWEWEISSNQVSWSNEMYRIFEIDLNSLITFEKFLSMVHPEDMDHVERKLKAAANGKQFEEFYHRIITKSGKIKILHARGQIILGENDVMRIVGTGQDVSAQKMAENEMLKQAFQLETANDELRKFAYVASHDLQEPLRKILTYLSLIENQTYDQKTISKYFDKMHDSASRMRNLIHDLLDYTRVTNEPLAFERVDLNRVLEEVKSDLEVKILQQQAQIQVADLPSVEAHPSQMRQLMQNLISNALKFHRPGMPPKVKIACKMINGGTLGPDHVLLTKYKFKDWDYDYYWAKEKFCRIQVIDNGIGFPEAATDRIFAPFERLHNYSQFKGSGIGLAICKKIIESHHGTITAETLEDYTVFTVLIPVSQYNFTN